MATGALFICPDPLGLEVSVPIPSFVQDTVLSIPPIVMELSAPTMGYPHPGEVRVLRGTSILPAGQTVLSVDTGTIFKLDRTYLRLTSIHAGVQPNAPIAFDIRNVDAGAFAAFVDGTRFGISKSQVLVEMRFDWEIVEYVGPDGGPNEFKVLAEQRLDLAPADAQQSEVIASANPAKVVPVLATQENVAVTFPADYCLTSVELFYNTGTQTVSATRNSLAASSTTVKLFLVEFTGANWTIGTGSASVAVPGAPEAQVVSDVGDWSNTFIETSWRTDHGENNESTFAVQPGATSTQLFLFSDAGATAAAQTFRWYTVSNPEMQVDHVTVAAGAGQTLLVQAVPAERNSEVVSVYATSTDSVDAASYPIWMWNYQRFNATTVAAVRARTGGSAIMALQRVQMPFAELLLNLKPETLQLKVISPSITPGMVLPAAVASFKLPKHLLCPTSTIAPDPGCVTFQVPQLSLIAGGATIGLEAGCGTWLTPVVGISVAASVAPGAGCVTAAAPPLGLSTSSSVATGSGCATFVVPPIGISVAQPISLGAACGTLATPTAGLTVQYSVESTPGCANFSVPPVGLTAGGVSLALDAACATFQPSLSILQVGDMLVIGTGCALSVPAPVGLTAGGSTLNLDPACATFEALRPPALQVGTGLNIDPARASFQFRPPELRARQIVTLQAAGQLVGGGGTFQGVRADVPDPVLKGVSTLALDAACATFNVPPVGLTTGVALQLEAACGTLSSPDVQLATEAMLLGDPGCAVFSVPPIALTTGAMILGDPGCAVFNVPPIALTTEAMVLGDPGCAVFSVPPVGLTTSASIEILPGCATFDAPVVRFADTPTLGLSSACATFNVPLIGLTTEAMVLGDPGCAVFSAPAVGLESSSDLAVDPGCATFTVPPVGLNTGSMVLSEPGCATLSVPTVEIGSVSVVQLDSGCATFQVPPVGLTALTSESLVPAAGCATFVVSPIGLTATTTGDTTLFLQPACLTLTPLLGEECYPLQYTRIHNAILEKSKQGPFVPVKYHKELKQACAIDSTTNPIVLQTPDTILVGEITSTFGTPLVNRRRHMQERHDWEWQLTLCFDCQVSVEHFEQCVLNKPIVLPAKDGLEKVTLQFVDANYTHPPQFGASTGTGVNYRVIAREGPK